MDYLPELKGLDTSQHVQVTGRVLLDDIGNIIRSERLPELASRHKVLYLSHGSDRMPVLHSQYVRVLRLRVALVDAAEEVRLFGVCVLG